MGFLLIGAVNGLSSVINNVAATAVFIPVAEGVASRFGASRSAYLMPVAFASMTGGMCTLIGTSTNIAVSAAMERAGLPALGLFELTPVGVVVAGVGALYLLYVAPRLLGPGRGSEAAALESRAFLHEIWVTAGSPFANLTLEQADLGRLYGLAVLAIGRQDARLDAPRGDEPHRAAAPAGAWTCSPQKPIG